MMRFAWQAQGFRALGRRCLMPPTQNPWKGCKFHVTEMLICSDHFAWQLQEFVCLRKVLFLSFKISFLREISQKSFVFELQSFNFEGSLAEKLRLTKSFESHIS